MSASIHDPKVTAEDLEALFASFIELFPERAEEAAGVRDVFRTIALTQRAVEAMVAAGVDAETIKAYAMRQLMLASRAAQEWRRKHEPLTAPKMH